MKTLKILICLSLIIIVGAIMFNASMYLGWLYVTILILTGLLILFCKCSAGNEEKIIKLESYLQKETNESNRKICKGILNNILPDDLQTDLNRRYKEARKNYTVRYEA